MNVPDTPNFVNEEEKTFWIESIMSDFREGASTPEDLENLRALMLEDPEARRIYLDSNQLNILLESTNTASSELSPQAVSPFQKIAIWAAVITAAFAVGAVATSSTWLSSNPDTSPVAQQPDSDPWLAILSSSNEAQWKGPAAVSGKFSSGTFELVSGVAELEFKNGAQLILEGPCALAIIDESKVELKYGKLWGHCPPDAQGFEVLAPGGNRIVDLGTEFGVGVDPSGSVEVHVFDGEVEIFSDDYEKQALEAGSAIQMSPGKRPFSLDANFESFTDATKLQRDLYDLYHSSILERDDLILYYDFSSSSETPFTLEDLGPSQTRGKVIGALPVVGRVPNKQGLLFEKRNDAVALDLRHLSLDEGFTIAMWVKPTDFSKSHMALLNSNGFAPGNIHFQIHDDGRLMTGIGEMTRFASPRGSIKKNIWQHVAVDWDLEKQEARLFVNGRLLNSQKSGFKKTTHGVKAHFGACQIGAWAKPVYGHNRSFVGRIDEVLLLASRLSESEVSKLFEQSHP